MDDTLRAFIAIELPETVIAALRKVQARLQTYRFKMRWVKTENIHLTLKFLGDIRAGDVRQVQQAVTEGVAGCGPFNLQAKGIGVFPGVKRARVLWAGLSGDTRRLVELQQAIDSRLAEIGIEREKKKYSGHLTLGRSKGRIDPRQLVDAMQQNGGFQSEPFTVDRAVLFQSRLKPDGAVYTRLHTVNL
jgi:2'-5' RNA ligase